MLKKKLLPLKKKSAAIEAAKLQADATEAVRAEHARTAVRLAEIAADAERLEEEERASKEAGRFERFQEGPKQTVAGADNPPKPPLWRRILDWMNGQ